MGKRLHLVVAAMFTTAGIGHFVRPDFFEAIMPEWVPDAPTANRVSGAAEIALGLGMIPAATRRVSGWGLLALLVAVFPANIDMAIHRVAVVTDDAGRWTRRPDQVTDARNWIRLPFQLLFGWLVFRAAGLGSDDG